MSKTTIEKFWQIKNLTKTKAELLIYGQIGDVDWWGDGSIVTPKAFNDDMKSIGDVTQLDVRINSPGGGVFAGMAIHNILRRHPANKTVYVDGVAASIASVIALAGDEIVMPTGSMMMIHNPMSVLIGYYNANEMREMAEYLDKMRDSLVSMYVDRCRKGKSSEEIIDMLDAETWMSAEEAVELGFADRIEQGAKMVATMGQDELLDINGVCFDPSKFKNMPKIAATVITPKPAKNEEDARMDIKDLMDKHPELYNAVREEGVQAERCRLKALDEMALPGHEGLINKAKYETGDKAETVAMQIVAAEKAVRTKMVADLQADAAPLLDVPGTPAPVDTKDQEIKAAAGKIAAAANTRRK